MAECEHCGESFREGRISCPHCGADAETGWKEDAEDLSIELPETSLSDDDYADLLRREGLSEGVSKARNLRGLIILAILLALLLPTLLAVLLWY